MHFDPDNIINKLCAQGMQLEGEGRPEEAAVLFMQAWDEAVDDIGKFTAAHYVARHQSTVADKLRWDEVALHHALKVGTEEILQVYPSLYLNIGKCYEDLGDLVQAGRNYEAAQQYASTLPADSYGGMIRSGIARGLDRLKYLG